MTLFPEKYRKIILTSALCVISSGFTYAFNTELHYQILHMREPMKPIIDRNTILLSYASSEKPHTVAIAFEHDHYNRLHSYEKNSHGVFVKSFPIPSGITELRYRLIVDGLWTTDPLADTAMNTQGMEISILNIPGSISAPPGGVEYLPGGNIRFVYKGTTGSHVALVGDFNRWDPFLLPMEESPIVPGHYSTVISPPADSRLYRYVVDGREIIDPANKIMLVDGWGRPVSVLP